MRKQLENEYWLCVIGTTNSKNLKDGADYPMRKAVKKAFVETVGHEYENCWSGWGVEKDRVDLLIKISIMNHNDPLYEAIKRILNVSNDNAK